MKIGMEIVKPSAEHLPSYFAALWRGWSPMFTSTELDRDEIARVTSDPEGFLSLQEDRQALGGPIPMPDGSFVPRLPGLHMWMWDGEYAGTISLRWQPGSNALPPTCLGHIGYGVVPWKRGRGYATAALAAMLPIAANEGLDYVEITTEPDNVGSQRVIEANGGGPPERFLKLDVHGGGEGLLYRIDLSPYR
jgi:predicted acetyltransferase